MSAALFLSMNLTTNPKGNFKVDKYLNINEFRETQVGRFDSASRLLKFNSYL